MPEANLTTAMMRIIRAALAIGLACFAGLSLAESDSETVIAERMRKGANGERENGLCARTGWPVHDRAELLPRYKQWLSGARMGTAAPWRWRSSSGCTTATIVVVRTLGGRDCLRTRTFVCTVGGSCLSSPGDWCPTDGGDFERCACS